MGASKRGFQPRLEFGHFESAEILLRSAFSRHFVAHFVETNRVRVRCSLTKNCRFAAKRWILPPRRRLGQVAWDKKHALVDHLSRVTESIVVNLAEAARQRGTPARLRIADYAIGSSLECAGCLDVARIKELLTHQDCHQEKHSLRDH